MTERRLCVAFILLSFAIRWNMSFCRRIACRKWWRNNWLCFTWKRTGGVQAVAVNLQPGFKRADDIALNPYVFIAVGIHLVSLLSLPFAKKTLQICLFLFMAEGSDAFLLRYSDAY